jgi:hypothetical protein
MLSASNRRALGAFVQDDGKAEAARQADLRFGVLT